MLPVPLFHVTGLVPVMLGPAPAEQYWRSQTLRRYRRHHGGSGAGLGLAIVGEICRAHQARISLHPAQPHGLLVRVAFNPL